MELFFLALLVLIMATALGSGFPVAFALPGAAIITISLAAGSGYLFAGSTDAFFHSGGPSQWLSAGVTNLRGVYWEVERDTLIAIPLFIFMGIMLQRSKIAEDLLVTMAGLFGAVPGGLGISVVFVGALLAATTGIVGATVVAMGLISLPAMLRNNYSQPLATGVIAASGTLGQIIPPSIVLIILADQLASAADQASNLRGALYKASTGELSMPSNFDVVSTSAGEMFLGALVPGLLLVGIYMTYILVFAILRPSSAPAVPYEGARDGAFWVNVVITLVPPLALIFLVLGSILGGIATVNQAGAIGAAGAMIMAGYRLGSRGRGTYHPAMLAVLSLAAIAYALSNYDLNVKSVMTSGGDMTGVHIGVAATVLFLIALLWSGLRVMNFENTLRDVMVETSKTTALVFIILLGAAMLTAAFRAFGGEELVRNFLNSLPGGFWTQFVIVMAVIFMLGFFLDFIEIAVVVVPIVAPILLADPAANITAVWLGVMIGLNIQTSFLTPPFGFALFYLRGVAPAAVRTISMYKGVIPFILMQLMALGIVGYYPQLVNYLPQRASLTSETAPPPRNPKLQQCLREYTAQRLADGELATVNAAIATLEGVDAGILPKKLAKGLSEGAGSAREALAQLAALAEADQAREQATTAYRPLHTEVRGIEKAIRLEEAEISEATRSLALIGDDAVARVALEEQIRAATARRDALTATIPSEWPAQYDAFHKLNLAYNKAQMGFQRAADSAWESPAQVLAVLDDKAGFATLPDLLAEARRVVETSSGDAGQDALKQIERQVGAVEGTREIKSALSKARRAIKGSDPDRAKAEAQWQKAMAAYEAQTAWRGAAEAKVAPAIRSYLDGIRESIGARQQPRLSKDQALYLAACQAVHKDISLGF